MKDVDLELSIIGDKIKNNTAIDITKLYSDCIGNYEFDVGEGQIIKFSLIKKDENIYMKTAGRVDGPTKITPIKGKALKFTGYDPNDYDYVGTFFLNEKGNIKGCMIFYPEMNTEFKAVKLK